MKLLVIWKRLVGLSQYIYLLNKQTIRLKLNSFRVITNWFVLIKKKEDTVDVKGKITHKCGIDQKKLFTSIKINPGTANEYGQTNMILQFSVNYTNFSVNETYQNCFSSALMRHQKQTNVEHKKQQQFFQRGIIALFIALNLLRSIYM